VRKCLVFIEQGERDIRKVSLEALSLAHQMSEGGEVVAVIFAPLDQEVDKKLGRYGAAQIIQVATQDSTIWSAEAYRQAMLQIVDHVTPDIIIIGHTAIGREIAPRIASRKRIGLISDCTAISTDEAGELIYTRPMYSGKAFSTCSLQTKQQMVTIRPNNFIAEELPQKSAPKVEKVSLSLPSLNILMKQVSKKQIGGIELSEANIIVAGGRGVKSVEGFEPLRELAKLLGAGLGASRGACDAGYCDYALQIGQTGKVVTPDIYIACGISGAVQHVAGMSQSKYIVAINKDPEADIFNIADLGIVGDLFEVVPLLTEKLKQNLG